jgi:hypothetical protein
MPVMGRRAIVRTVTTTAVIVLFGCGSDSSDESVSNTLPERTTTATTLASPLEGVTGELIVTRQRDLLDRGLINVLTRNDSDTSILLDDIELVADFFEGRPAASRTISARSGRHVAIQVPYGMAVDCDTGRTVRAALTFTYRTDSDPEPKAGGIALGGTDILDSIRTEQCVSRRFDKLTNTRFDGTEIVDGSVVTDLVIEPNEPSDLAVSGASGTVLVGVRLGGGWAGSRLDGESVTVPLTFVVNRCDPHALAEVTTRYGLDLAVSVDGEPPVSVAVDVSDLDGDLETIVDQCTAATAGD